MRNHRIVVDKSGGATLENEEPPPQKIQERTVAEIDESRAMQYQLQMGRLLDRAIENNELDSAVRGILSSITSSPDTMASLVRTIGQETLIWQIFRPALKGEQRLQYLRMILSLIHRNLTSFELSSLEGIQKTLESLEEMTKKLPTR